jgi:cytosine/adenosine deaminase-related metal-dependent hydrolase
LRFDAAGVYDAKDVAFAPGSLLLEVESEAPTAPVGPLAGRARVLAVGRPGEVDAHPAARVGLRIARPGAVLIPGLVNAHAHLDLTHLGPVALDERRGFDAFLERVRLGRRTDEAGIAESVRRGVELSRAGGVVAVGDIAGAPMGRPSTAAYRALGESGLAGVSFLEFFAVGATQEASIARLRITVEEAPERIERVALGLQPHAPYSVMPPGYGAAIEIASGRMPLATHLAETLDEREFIARATGPQRALLDGLGIWNDSVLAHIGRGRRPVEHLAPHIAGAGFVCAHVNDASDADIELLARAGACVAYCPRASEYFRAAGDFGPHRYRDMLSAGIPVALGTDSIMNLPAWTGGPRGRISTLDEMRLLHRRDGAPARALLAMATLHGARALRLDAREYQLEEGATPRGIVCVPSAGSMADPLAGALNGLDDPEVLFFAR